MNDVIIEKLKTIEKEEDIKILFAVESGSRAWGFPSKDSDYDVRFIYIHTLDWYLSIDKKRDVLEYTINDLLDISGWDITKALNLFRSCNPSLMEWLYSPIIYLQQALFINDLKDLSNTYFSPKASMYHYFNMAKANYKSYLQSDKVRVKKYLYVLRPILACKWLENNKTIPPVEFNRLIETQINNDELLQEIRALLHRKRLGEEIHTETRIDIINDFIDKNICYYSEFIKNLKDNDPINTSILNDLFRKTLEEIWG
ncbi:nucleotidyltransferase domain-containing protein [Hathewaya histolytica]|uniref:Nucleotidyltransferase n=1 Tax=Hathewaya histolytica TaxID=1498 RepID=A0A4U9RDY3_HATHI|nr:nucleotidyltransferase domain-containing protein [Hathewaya histolytica]VTQ89191.1 nucleotidyltransferase [Hathewaya histolytica]